jgi:hypothetical protein
MKVKFIHLSDARGKIGGAVASKNKAGNYFRSKTSPINPQTIFQTAQRALFALISQAWRGLTVIQRQGWAAIAAEATQSNVFGDSIKLSGSQLFSRLNLNTQLTGNAQVSDAPSPLQVVPSLITSIVADVVTGDITITQPAAVPAGKTMVLYFTPVISAGRNFVKNDYRFLMSRNNSSGTTGNLKAAYEARFGTSWLVVGKVFYVKYKTVDNATGYESSVSVIKIISEA